MLVEKLSMLYLRLKRVCKADLQTAPTIFDRVKDGLGDSLQLSPPHKAIVTLDTVLRYEASLERQIDRALSWSRQLRRMREISLKPIGEESGSAENEPTGRMAEVRPLDMTSLISA
jgi:hypothetical protein